MPPPGRLTPMPSVTLSLPPHVVAKPRKDGTSNVLFIVRRDRPRDWPSTIPLPLTAPRRGNLGDPDELQRILADAAKLSARLERQRSNVVPGVKPGTLAWLALRWTGSAPEHRHHTRVAETCSPDWRALKFRSRQFYIDMLRPLEAWAESLGEPPLERLSLPAILAFLELYADRPAMRAGLKRTMSALFSYGVRTGALRTHPFGVAVRMRRQPERQKRAVQLWDAAAVHAYAGAAEAAGWIGGAILLRLMWETSADASDCITWRKREHFIDDTNAPAIAYGRGKSEGRTAPTRISQSLADLIRRNGALFLVTDPSGQPYGPSVEDDNRRGYHLRRLKKAVVASGGPALLFDHLRHSALTDAVEKGASMTQTQALSRHRSTAMLESVYVQFTASQIDAVQRARGIE